MTRRMWRDRQPSAWPDENKRCHRPPALFVSSTRFVWHVLHTYVRTHGRTDVIRHGHGDSVLRTDSPCSDEGLLEGKNKALTTKDTYALPFNRLQYMRLMTMITDDLIMRFVRRSVTMCMCRVTRCRFGQTFCDVGEGWCLHFLDPTRTRVHGWLWINSLKIL